MKSWIFFPVLASAGFVLPVARMNVAFAPLPRPAQPRARRARGR